MRQTEIEIGWSVVSTMPRQGHFGIVCSWPLACVVAHAELVELQEQTSNSSASFVAFTWQGGRCMRVWNLQLMIRRILAGSIRLLVPRALLVPAKTPAAASDDARGTWVIQQKVSESNSETDRDRDRLVSCVYNATTRPFWHSLQLAAGVCCGTCRARRVARADGRFFCELCCIHCASRQMRVWNLQLMIRHILAGNIRLLVPRAVLVLAKTPAAASDDARGTWVIQQKVFESNNETDRDRYWLVSCVYNATTRPFGIVCSWPLACVVAHAELVELQEQTAGSSVSFVAFTWQGVRCLFGTSS